MKPPGKKKATKSSQPVKSIPEKKKTDSGAFLRFIFKDKINQRYLIAGLIIGVLYAIVLKMVFPKPSFFFDSGTYIQAAKDNVAVSFRPLGYSDFIRFFHDISPSATFLVMTQYAFNVVANLFLFFTFLYFFPLSKWYRLALFVLLMCNPLYLLYSNYILSEAFFCSMTIMWLVVLFWMIRQPNWLNFFLQLILLTLLFKLRYNAILFPVFTTAAIILSKQSIWKKGLGIAISFVIIFVMVQRIADKTEEVTGTHVFSAFGGWQLATNALNIMRHVPIDSTSLSSPDSKEIYSLSKNYFDTLSEARSNKSSNEINASYLWDPNAPLKRYLPIFAKKRYINTYFKAWVALGPVFSEFGQAIIIKHPVQFFKYFIWPNTILYWYPPLEAYESYNDNKEAIIPLTKTYYHYPADAKIDLSHCNIHNAIMHPWRYLFPIINAIFFLLAAAYFFTGAYKKTKPFFNVVLLFTLAFYLYNFGFTIVLAPTVFRYHVEIITLCVIFSVYLLYFVLESKKMNNTTSLPREAKG